MMLTPLKRIWPLLLWMAVLFAALYGCYRMGYRAHEAKQTADDLAATRQALSNFVTEAQRINGVAGRIEQQTYDLAKQTSTHTVEYRTHVQTIPMPADCRPDAGRLQHIDAAVADANAAVAGKPDAPMSTD